MKKKILVYTSSFPRWEGDFSGHFVLNLSRRLGESFDVTVLAPNFPGSKKKEVLPNLTILRYRYFPFEKCEILAGETGIFPSIKANRLLVLLVPFFLLSGFLNLLLLALKSRPDVIHAHWLFPQGTQAALVKKISGVPFIVTAHGADVFGLSKGIWKYINKFTVKNAKAITTVSNALSKKICEQYKPMKKPFICPMGVDSDSFWMDTLDKKKAQNLLFVGRLSEKKGVEYLLRAMSGIIKVHPSVTLTIVGSGELEANLKRLAFDLSISDHVYFKGKVNNVEVANYYKEAGIFIGPSVETKDGDTEGFGLTFVEASLSGCLVIATNVGGISDIIQDGITGRIIKQNNSASIENHVNDTIKHWDDYISVIKNAQKYCYDRYEWNVIAKKYISIFNTTI